MNGGQKRFSITISRQMGSLGFEIAQLVAQQLDFRMVWREVINEAARIAGAPEVALAAIDELGFLGICPSPEACQAYQLAVREVLLELASQGNTVILGRAGQVILKNRLDAFHVRLIAPINLRAYRIAARYQVTYEGALAQVRSSDRFRSNYLKRYYQSNWDDPTLYDLVINSAKIDPTSAARIILLAVENWQRDITEGSKTKDVNR